MSLTEQQEAQAIALTSKVEKSESVSDELNAMPYQERLAVARRMDELNADNRKTNPSLPDLELVTKKDINGNDHLMDMTARKIDDFLYFDKTTDVYNMPQGVEHKPTDYVFDTRVTRDLEDTHIRFQDQKAEKLSDY